LRHSRELNGAIRERCGGIRDLVPLQDFLGIFSLFVDPLIKSKWLSHFMWSRARRAEDRDRAHGIKFTFGQIRGYARRPVARQRVLLTPARSRYAIAGCYEGLPLVWGTAFVLDLPGDRTNSRNSEPIPIRLCSELESRGLTHGGAPVGRGRHCRPAASCA
jgi:hypothetical protein